MRGVIVMVDLHAAEIDECLALAPGCFEGGQGLSAVPWKYRFPLYIQRIRLQATLLSGLGQPDRIEDAGGHAIAVGGTQNLGLAKVGGGGGRLGGEAR